MRGAKVLFKQKKRTLGGFGQLFKVDAKSGCGLVFGQAIAMRGPPDLACRKGRAEGLDQRRSIAADLVEGVCARAVGLGDLPQGIAKMAAYGRQGTKETRDFTVFPWA